MSVGHSRGRFITFEGGEGAGKSTQVQRLVARLGARGVETIATREPGGSPGAERLREVILSGAVKPFGPQAEALMFAAARSDHLENTIRPALAEGCFVVCDRFIDSTRAYQGASGNVDPALLRGLEKAVVGDTVPDLTIVLDIPVSEGMKRAGVRRATAASDRFESEATSFHETVRQAFLDLARVEPQRFLVVDATQPPDEAEQHIWKEVERRFFADESTGPSENRTPPGAEPSQTEPVAPQLVAQRPDLRAKTRGHLKVIEGSGGSAPRNSKSKPMDGK